KKINAHTVEVLFSDSQRMTFDFYGENIFKLFQDIKGGIIRDPKSDPEANILVDNPRKEIQSLQLREEDNQIHIETSKIDIQLDKTTGLLKILNKENNQVVLE